MPNHDLIDRRQTCVHMHGEAAIQKVKGTHNIAEAEAVECPLDRLGNLNTAVVANRARLSAVSSLTQADNMVTRWKERIRQHKKLLAMMLDVSKSVMN